MYNVYMSCLPSKSLSYHSERMATHEFLTDNGIVVIDAPRRSIYSGRHISKPDSSNHRLASRWLNQPAAPISEWRRSYRSSPSAAALAHIRGRKSELLRTLFSPTGVRSKRTLPKNGRAASLIARIPCHP